MQTSAVPNEVTGQVFASKVPAKSGTGYELIFMVPDSEPNAGPLADGLFRLITAEPFEAGKYVSPSASRDTSTFPLSIALGFGGYSKADSIRDATLELTVDGDSLSGPFHLWWVGGDSLARDSVWFRGTVAFPH